MTYRLRLEVQSVDAAIRALDLLNRLDVPMLELETARQPHGFLVHLAFEAPSAQAARHIGVRIAQLVGVMAAEMAPAPADVQGEGSLPAHDRPASLAPALPPRC